MMRHLASVILVTALLGCKAGVDLDPNLDTRSTVTTVYDAFEGVIDGVPTVHRYGPGHFMCNPADLFTYEYDSGAAVLNTDGTQVVCTVDLFTRSTTGEDLRPENHIGGA